MTTDADPIAAATTGADAAGGYHQRVAVSDEKCSARAAGAPGFRPDPLQRIGTSKAALGYGSWSSV
jgi:hypothetical protein